MPLRRRLSSRLIPRTRLWSRRSISPTCKWVYHTCEKMYEDNLNPILKNMLLLILMNMGFLEENLPQAGQQSCYIQTQFSPIVPYTELSLFIYIAEEDFLQCDQMRFPASLKGVSSLGKYYKWYLYSNFFHSHAHSILLYEGCTSRIHLVAAQVRILEELYKWDISRFRPSYILAISHRQVHTYLKL